MSEIEIKPNITGVIDLLGFSSHLNLVKGELTSPLGEGAKKRLINLGTAVYLVNCEIKNINIG